MKNDSDSIANKAMDESIDMDNYEFTEAHTNKPFFDWKQGEMEYGAFGAICKDGFTEFVKEKFLIDLTNLRRSYIKRDYNGLRFWVHKYKGSFK